MRRLCRLGLWGLDDVRIAWAVVGEEQDVCWVAGCVDVVVEVRFEGDFRRRFEDEEEVRREVEPDSCPAA